MMFILEIPHSNLVTDHFIRWFLQI